MSVENVVIIGSGPAGYTAALYTARANLNPLLIEGYQSGGQLMMTTEVENFPGFPKGVMGPELMQNFRAQAERFGTRFLQKNVTQVDFSGQPLKVFCEKEEFQAKTVIVATGASARWLGLESEQRLIGRGVSSCATCDGAFFRDEKVMVIGGGDSAIEEANFLTRFASSVTLVHRRDKLRASKIMQEKVFKNEKINIVWDSVPEEVLGEDGVKGVVLKNVKTNEKQTVECTGFFLAIGHSPNIDFLKGQIDLDDTGYINIPSSHSTATNAKGVFACGDVTDHVYRQAITAAGSGCQAAIDAERHLETLEG